MKTWTEAAGATAMCLLAGVVVGSCAREREESFPNGVAADSVAARVPAVPLSEIVAAARGFPAMWTLEGAPLADGTYTRWVEDDLVHVTLRYVFTDGRVVEEETSFAVGPPLEQRTWRWTEWRTDSGQARRLRRFDVDLHAGTASSERSDDGELDRDEGDIEVERGKTFAGFGFTLALQSLRDRLVEGAVVELRAVVFMFGARTVGVEVSHVGVDTMRMAGRELTGDRFDIVPQVPWLVDLVVDAPTSHIWLVSPPPPEFLRFEGPLVEPGDPRVRVDLLPGTESGPARPESRPHSDRETQR